MNERPILFSAEMVRAILDGRKTQTRRVVKPPKNLSESVPKTGWYLAHYQNSGEWSSWAHEDRLATLRINNPYGKIGDTLWVRETWNLFDEQGINWPKGNGLPKSCPEGWHVIYGEDADDDVRKVFPFRPSIHMPRWASRIQLEITDVRVERLQDISEDDAKAEGVLSDEHASPEKRFQWLWESINGANSWESNPWVWVVEFERKESE